MKRVHLIAGISVGVAFCLSVWLGWMFLLAPAREKLEAAEKTFQAKEAELTTARAKAKQHEKFRAEAENVNRNLAFVRSRIDASFGPNDVYRLLSGFGGSQGLVKLSIRPMKEKKEGTLMAYPVEVSFEGTYHRVGAFINDAISNRRVVVPTGMDLVNQDPTGRERQPLKATLEFKVFAEAPVAAKKAGAK